MQHGPELALVNVDDEVLDRLTAAATGDASADEVTPAITPGRQWTQQRVQWLRSFHHERRNGLAGPAREATWAILVADEVAGSVRLQATELIGVAEIGVWLTRGARERGVASAALAAVLHTADTLGFAVVRARTTAGNFRALRVLDRLGFVVMPADGDGDVAAQIVLTPGRAHPPSGHSGATVQE